MICLTLREGINVKLLLCVIYCASAEDTKGMRQFMPSRHVVSEGSRPEDYAEGRIGALKTDI